MSGKWIPRSHELLLCLEQLCTDEKSAEGSRTDGDTGGGRGWASKQEPWRSACIGTALPDRGMNLQSRNPGALWGYSKCLPNTRGVRVIWHCREMRCPGWGKIAGNVFSCNICTGHDPSWGAMQVLLKELFCPGERGKIIAKQNWHSKQKETGTPGQWMTWLGMIMPQRTGLHVKQEFKTWLKQYYLWK